MQISVIIPSYKPQNYLWECLRSLINQTFSKNEFEVIIVLNGCGEPWKNQIERFISLEMVGMNIKFIHTHQSGVSNARNLALNIAEGDYVTFIDDDDYISNNYLEELRKKSSEDTIAIACPYAFNDGSDVEIEYRVTNEFRRIAKNGVQNAYIARRLFSGPWMKLIPMSYIHERRFNTKFKVGEDSLFMFLISDKFKNVAFADETVKYYRRYRNNSAITVKKSACFLVSNATCMICEYFKIYFSHPFKYDFRRFIFAILGAIKGVIVNI